MDKQAATRNFSLRVPEEPYTEVGKIACRYNQVMDSLEDYSKEIEALNTNLESTVQERTAELATANLELTNANNNLKRLDRLKDDFLANTSHELRTPLNGIIGLSEYLLEGGVEPVSTQMAENLAMISKSGRRLYELVSDLLDFSKILHDNLALNLRAVELRAVCELVLTLCRPMVGEKNLRLVNNISSELPLVWADESRLQQIFYNLVSNAIKFTESGEITVEASLHQASKQELVISVVDEGIGIEKEKQEIIFDSFAQVSGAASRAYGGLGLGLTIAQKLTKLHGGTIWVNSTIGEGTTFSFTLPVYEQTQVSQLSATPLEQLSVPVFISDRLSSSTASLSADLDTDSSVVASFEEDETFAGIESFENSKILVSETLQVAPSATQQPAQILIVDDDPINLQVLDNYLQLLAYEVVQARSGQEALEILNAGFQPDLVILDVMMPKMTGYEVTKTIRATKGRDELPIVLLTAKSLLQDEVIGLAAGANDYLTKPIVKEGLMARISTQLALRQESRERQQAQADRLAASDFSFAIFSSSWVLFSWLIRC